MKKQFLLFVAVALFSFSSSMAQDAARARQSPEERTKATMERMAQFDLTGPTRTSVEAIFTDFFKAQQSAQQEFRSTGADRPAFIEKRKRLTGERDAKLKQILSEEQYSKWISEVEPSLRPQKAPAAAPAKAPKAN